jgi:hypothetical protein
VFHDNNEDLHYCNPWLCLNIGLRESTKNQCCSFDKKDKTVSSNIIELVMTIIIKCNSY